MILEPARAVLPPPGYLQALRARCDAIGAALIFDEIVLGFRLARAGGQEYFGVLPDLSVFGKALGAGLPLAAIVGPAHYMRHASSISSTFGGETLALAAAGALLDVYEREDVIGRIQRAGERILRTLEPWHTRAGVTARGFPARFELHFTGAAPEHRLLRFTAEAAAHGVLLHPAAVYPSAALTGADLEQSCRAIDLALESTAREGAG